MVKKFLYGVILVTGGVLESGAQMAHQFSWSFPEGNLVSNWSFERDADETCMSATGSPFAVTDCKLKLSGAPSGDFVMQVTPGAVSTGQSPSTDFLRIEPDALFSFSIWVKGLWDAGNTGRTAPVLEFFTEGKVAIGNPLELDPYESILDVSSDGWSLYESPFQVPAQAAFLKVRLLKVLSLQAQSNTFYFDNLLIQPAAGKMGVTESRSYQDALGTSEQSVTGNGKSDIVSFTTYDPERRPRRRYVPVALPKQPSGGDFSLIAVGTKAVGEDLNYDFSTLSEAYVSLSDWAASIPASQIPSVVIHVVVDSGSPDAPLGTPLGQDFTPLISQDNQDVPLEIVGIFRGSPAYDALVGLHGPPLRPTPASLEYSLAGLDPATYQAQYPGESNFFSEFAYPLPGENTFDEAALPGSAYAMASGHTDKSGWALVTPTTNTSTDPEITGPGAPAGTDGLLYQWTRDRQGQYAMSLSNPEGLLTHAGQRLDGQWNEAVFGYDSFNRPVSTLSPAGVLSTSGFDGQGRTTQTVDPDRGQTDFLYDDFGRLRFVHPAENGTPTAMVAHKYDASGRLVQSGTTPYDWDEARAEESQTYPSANLETGRIYDAITAAEWQDRTGVPWSTLGISLAQLKNGKGRLVAAYNRNPECTAPGFAAAPERRLAASIYSYDSLGRLETLFKWIGAAEIPSDRIQKITYTYDGLGRLMVKKVFATGLGNLLVNAQRFEYDEDGRVAAVLDKDSRAMVTYAFDDLGRLEEARLYGKFRVGWTYSIRGEARKIEATTISANPEYIFSEEMGYEDKSNPSAVIPAPTNPRFDGSISSILRKFSKDVTGPVELSQYEYDDLGRLVQADRVTAGAQSQGIPVLNPDGSLNLSNLSFTTGASTATEGYAYDPDGAITSQTRPGTGAHAYAYHGTTSDPSHKVKDVSGNRATGQPMTASGGNFRYDSRGRMTDDIGSQKHFTYGYYNDRVIVASVPGRTFHQLYDENLNRVAELEVNASGVLIGSKVTLYESGLKVMKEFVFRSTSHPLGGVGLVKNSLMGMSGLVGFEDQATGQKKLILKDHLGSAVKVLDEATGGYSGQEEYAYWAYGILNRRVVVSGDQKPFGTYTGKEYEEALGLYYFGARFYDPELGFWITPDAANQYFNSYSYSGENPVMLVDADGNIAFLIPLAIIAIGGAINVASNYDKIDNFGEGLGYFAIGAGQSAASIYLGPVGGIVAGGLAGGLNTALGGGNMGQIIQGGISGTIGSAAGLGASKLMGPVLSKIDFQIGGVSSPFTQALARGALGGAVGGFAGGFASGFVMSGGDLNAGLNAGLSGLKTGAVTGAITSAGAQTAASLSQGRNPLLKDPFGNPNGSIPKPPGVPENWVPRLSDNGKGVIWVDPNNRHNSVRVMQGDPLSPYPNSRTPNVRHIRDGQYLDEYGNPVPKKSSDSHIPLSNWEWPFD